MSQNLVDLASNKELTMSSLEISELTGKEHFHVCRDIRKMLSDLYQMGDDTNRDHPSGVSETKDNRGYTACFNLDYTHTVTLVAGYNAKLRIAIIKRWKELEEQNIVAYAAGILLNMASKIPLGESKDLYIIHFTDGTCKVGRSKNVPERVNTVRTSSGRSIVKYFHIKDKGNFEQPILKALEPVRLEGEFVQEGYLDYVLDLVKGLTKVTELTPVHFN